MSTTATDEDQQQKTTTSHVSTITGSLDIKDWSEWDQNIDYGFCFNSVAILEKGAIKVISSNYEEISTITDFDTLVNNKRAVGNYSHIMNQHNGRINDMWTLLDSQSTVDVICNKRMLKNVHQVNTRLKIFSTGGMAPQTQLDCFSNMATCGFMKLGSPTFYLWLE